MTPDPVYRTDVPVEPVRLDPFENTNWKSAAARDEWAELLDTMSKAKTFAEWYSVLDPDCARDAAIIHINNYNREKWLRRLGEHDLHYRDIRYSKPYGGFSHKFFPTDEHDPERLTYAVIGQTEEIVEEMKDAELNGGRHARHDIVGQHLGFPDCCRSFFNDEWVGEGDTYQQRKIDPMYEITCNSGNAERIDGDPHTLQVMDPNPGANVLWRYFGWSFVTHLPCSWDCEASIEIARNRYRIMAENGYEDAANALYHWLSSPHTWDGLHGICNVRNQYMTAESTTSSYWEKKTIVWDKPHAPGGAVPGTDDAC